MSTKDLAERICNYEAEYNRKPSAKRKGSLSPNISIEISDDRMMWYLWLSEPDQVRKFFKAVPAMRYDCDSIYRMLKAQRWVCI